MYVCIVYSLFAIIYVRTYVRKYRRMYVCTYVRKYSRMYVCTYVRKYRRMYVCTYLDSTVSTLYRESKIRRYSLSEVLTIQGVFNGIA